MKQYTTPEQTAKLIELGFETPKSIIDVLGVYKTDIDMEYEYEYAYSTGELIEMLPNEIMFDGTKYNRVISKNEVFYYSWIFEVYYHIFDIHNELIDNLFYMVVKLKEEGVI